MRPQFCFGMSRRGSQIQLARLFLSGLALILLAACSQAPSRSPQRPSEYLNNALDWIQVHAVLAGQVDWDALRQEATELANGAETTLETHPALEHVLETLCRSGDRYAFLSNSEQTSSGENGLATTYPEGIVALVRPGSPADQAGIQLGDQVVSINGQAFAEIADPCDYQLDQFATHEIHIRRSGEQQPLQFSLQTYGDGHPTPTGRRLTAPWQNIGYLELFTDVGTELYPTNVQDAMRSVDENPTCGWILDLRRIHGGGNLWSYLAALGPLLGDGHLGGFVYQDGRQEPWSYTDGQVIWDGVERDESYVRGSIYELKNPEAPVALLTSELTLAAGENVVVAFQGRPQVKVFGEPTAGIPFLTDWTGLSDGAQILVSGAFSEDRLGNRYEGPLHPDVLVETDWARFGSDQDPVLGAAANWLQAQPACSGDKEPG